MIEKIWIVSHMELVTRTDEEGQSDSEWRLARSGRVNRFNMLCWLETGETIVMECPELDTTALVGSVDDLRAQMAEWMEEGFSFTASYGDHMFRFDHVPL